MISNAPTAILLLLSTYLRFFFRAHSTPRQAPLLQSQIEYNTKHFCFLFCYLSSKQFHMNELFGTHKNKKETLTQCIFVFHSLILVRKRH